MSDVQPPTPAEALPAETEVAAAAVTDGAYALFVADFNDTETAMAAYETLRGLEDGRTLAVEGVIVVSRSADGELTVEKATDHSTKRGLTWGLVGGAVLGVIFPPSILGSAVAVGAVGAAVGKALQLGHKSELANELSDAIAPGHSGIVALVSDPGAVEIRRALERANGIVEKAVDKVVADDVKAAAKAAESEAPAE